MRPNQGVSNIIIIINVAQPIFLPIIIMKSIEDYSNALVMNKAYHNDYYISVSRRGTNSKNCV